MSKARAETTPPRADVSNPKQQVGVPFNFSGILDCILIPRVIAMDRGLPPGARLMWGVIRQAAWKDGICRATEAQLGQALGVKVRQARKYCGELQAAGLLKTTQRIGRAPSRVLLLDQRFKVKPGTAANPMVVKRTEGETIPPEIEGGHRHDNTGDPGTIVPEGRHDSAALYKERGSFGGCFTGSKVISSKSSAQDQEPAARESLEGDTRASGISGTVQGRSAAPRKPTLEQMQHANEISRQRGIPFIAAMALVFDRGESSELRPASEILREFTQDQPSGKT